MKKAQRRDWSDEDLKRLAVIITAGGTPFRAAAALNRTIASCRIKARKLGTPFDPNHIIRRNLREKLRAAEQKLAER